MKWADQYKHPNWQRKRLEALEDAEFRCQRCGDDEAQLHVHHKRYVKGRAIWEYGTSELSVLCESCHEHAHEVKDWMQTLLARIHAEGSADVLAVVAGYVNHVQGPARASAEDVIDFIEDPFDVCVGRLAAAAGNRLSLESITKLCEFLEGSESGSSTSVTIPTRKWFGVGEEE